VRVGCGRSGGSCWAAFWHASMPLCIFMHAGLLAGRRALGEVSRTAVGQVPSLTAAGRQSFLPQYLLLPSDGMVSVRERFWKEGHAMARCWLLFATVTRKQHIFCDPARVKVTVWVARRVVTTTNRHRTSVIQTDLVWSGLISCRCHSSLDRIADRLSLDPASERASGLRMWLREQLMT
jgi:hypothetical protein